MPKKRIFTKEEIENAIALYNADVTVKEIAKTFACSLPFMSKVLKQNGVNVINKKKILRFDLDKDVLPMLSQGYSLTYIADKLHTDRHKMSKQLKERGYEVRNQQNETKFDDKVFDCIDTEEKAYWLGFIYADGYISTPRKSGKHEYTFELSLAISDIDHLYKFQKFLKFNHDRVKASKVVSKTGEYYRCRLSFSNKHLWNVLKDYGCTPSKSLTLDFPSESIFCGEKEKMILSFIKGYFDGDGCLSYVSHNTKNGKHYSAVAKLLGTKAFLEKVMDYLGLGKNLRLENINKNNSSGKTYTLCFSQNETQKLIKLFYINTDICLERKQKRALLFNGKIVDEEEMLKFLENENIESNLMKENCLTKII